MGSHGRHDRDADLFDRLVHDLRNPLGVIAYYAEAVPVADGAERDELCRRLAANAQRALHVLEEFALLSELRQGGGEPGDEGCDWMSVARDVVAAVETAERRPGRVRCRLDPCPGLRMARLHFECALRGLVVEAVRGSGMEEDLSVELSGGRAKTATLSVTVTSRNGARPAFGEDGMAIEIAQRLAALYGGELTIEREAGRSCVTVRLGSG